MAYLELSKEAYNDIIQAAGMKGAKVARVCEDQGVWSAEATQEAPPNVQEPDTFETPVEEPVVVEKAVIHTEYTETPDD